MKTGVSTHKWHFFHGKNTIRSFIRSGDIKELIFLNTCFVTGTHAYTYSYM